MTRRISLTCGFALVAFIYPTAIRAQDLVKEAQASFPRETIRLEYSALARLRALPNYGTLRQRFVGARLQVLEASLAQLGIREGDLDELVLGWQMSGAEWELYGLAAGRFDSKALADRAAARGVLPGGLAGHSAYCLTPEAAADCVLILKDSLGAFGSLRLLGVMLEARNGQAASLAADDRFTRLVSEAPTQAPIWGVAVGPAVADWFRAWMPGQGNLQMDWSRAFQKVEALAYSVEATEKVRLDVRLDCASPEAAMSTRQLLEGLKTFQQLAWQNQNPTRPNPFEALEVEADARRVLLKLTAAYEAIEGAGTPGAP